MEVDWATKLLRRGNCATIPSKPTDVSPRARLPGKAVDDEQRLVDNDRVPPCLVADDIDAPGLQLGEHSVRQPEEPARMAALPAIRAGERRANQGPGVPSVSSIRPWPMWNVGVRALVRFHSLDFIGRCRKG